METILLLHGAIGSKQQLLPLEKALQEKYIVHSINFSGHGGADLPAEGFSIPFFAQQVLEYLEENAIVSTNIFGYSMGGYVAMFLARYYPASVKKIVTLASKFYWDEIVTAKEVPMLNAGTIESKLPAFAAELKQRHAPQDWKIVLEKTRELLLGLGKKNALHLDDYKFIQNPCLLLLGDRDKMITLEETLDVYRNLPDAQFGMLPATPHPVEKVDTELLAFLICRFLK